MVSNKTAWKHGAARAVKAIFAVLGALTIVFFAFFGGEFSTLKTLNRVEDDANLFTMEYKADYALDRFLKIGASTDTELIEFIVRQVLKGIPLKFDLPNLGCSTFAAKLADGTPIFGRNFDMYDSPALLVTTRPKDGYASISMVNLAYIGYNSENLPTSLVKGIMTLAAPYAPLDGVNEKGLAVGVLRRPRLTSRLIRSISRRHLQSACCLTVRRRLRKRLNCCPNMICMLPRIAAIISTSPMRTAAALLSSISTMK